MLNNLTSVNLGGKFRLQMSLYVNDARVVRERPFVCVCVCECVTLVKCQLTSAAAAIIIIFVMLLIPHATFDQPVMLYELITSYTTNAVAAKVN